LIKFLDVISQSDRKNGGHSGQSHLSAHAQIKINQPIKIRFPLHEVRAKKEGRMSFRGRPESIIGDQNAPAIKNKNVIRPTSVSGESLFGPNRRKCSPG
jgi:hypothetical protein